MDAERPTRFPAGLSVSDPRPPDRRSRKYVRLQLPRLRARPSPAGSKRLDAITNEDVQRLKHRLQNKAVRTVNNVLSVLSMTLKKAVEWQVIEHMPCMVRLLKVPQGALSFYDFEEYESLVSAAGTIDSQALVVVLLGGDAGLRAGEMRAPEWTDVNFNKRQLCVARSDWHGHVTATKGGRLRYIALTDRLAAALQGHRHLKGPRVLYHPDGRTMAEHHIVELLRKVARRANVKINGPHILRHTFCSHLAMRGAPTRAIQELAGHRDLTTTQRYMHLSPNAVSMRCDCWKLVIPPQSVETLWRRQKVDSHECDVFRKRRLPFDSSEPVTRSGHPT